TCWKRCEPCHTSPIPPVANSLSTTKAPSRGCAEESGGIADRIGERPDGPVACPRRSGPTSVVLRFWSRYLHMTPFTGDLMPLNHITRTLWVIAFASLIAACGGGDDKEEDMLDVADVEDTADTANDSTPDFLTECTESADCTDLSRPNC